jgi:Na+/H+ antiporter NhaD/arsenite permease-like protein
MAAVLMQRLLPDPWKGILPPLVMLAMGLLSLALTPRGLRAANAFTWGPIIEVAVLFAGIFVTMVPALELLKAHGKEVGVTAPWQYFWLTGGLSAFLDNAPTYLAFATMAAGNAPLSTLALGDDRTLQAISCGAVFLGALTYIGNGPNFMVKAIADEAGYRMPSFFGYLFYSCLTLLPVFVLVTAVFFRP